MKKLVYVAPALSCVELKSEGMIAASFGVGGDITNGGGIGVREEISIWGEKEDAKPGIGW